MNQAVISRIIEAMRGCVFNEEDARILTTAVRARTKSDSLTSAQLLHIYVEVAQGRGRHGHFLRAFAGAVSRADHANFVLLTPVAIMFASQYHLTDYLDNFTE
jgi:hypothetical protein